MFSGKKSSILILDSNKSILRVFRRLLEKNGYQVVTAETSKEAVQKLHCNSIDAALMDIELPDIDCADVLFQIHETAPKMVKIIFNGLPKLEKSIDDDSCEVFLEKPVNPAKLLTVIKEILQRKKVTKN